MTDKKSTKTNSSTETEVDLYPKFYKELWEQYNLTKEEIIKWTYAGFFHIDVGNIRKNIVPHLPPHILNEHNRGVRIWKDVMGEIEIPSELSEYECVCGVSILWNHVLVEDPNAEELSVIIIGSECIDKFLNISRKRKCKICREVEIRNTKLGMCKECKAKHDKICKTEGCNNPKINNYHAHCQKCTSPKEWCPCGNNRKKIYKGERMPLCYQCYCEKQKRKNKSNKSKK